MGISYYIKMIVIFLELFNLNLIRITLTNIVYKIFGIFNIPIMSVVIFTSQQTTPRNPVLDLIVSDLNLTVISVPESTLVNGPGLGPGTPRS